MDFYVSNQKITRTDNDVSGAGTRGFLKFRIVFSPEWDAYTKTAVFSRKGSDRSYYVYDIISGAEYDVPAEVLCSPGICYVNVFGNIGDSRTAASGTAFFVVEKNAASPETADDEITPSLFAQLSSKIDGAISQFFSKSVVLSSDGKNVFWKYRDEEDDEKRTLFSLDSLLSDMAGSFRIERDGGAVKWKCGDDGEWEELFELSSLKGDKGDDGKTGNVIFASFDVDPVTGLLSINTPVGYDGPGFSIKSGHLEVTV